MVTSLELSASIYLYPLYSRHTMNSCLPLSIPILNRSTYMCGRHRSLYSYMYVYASRSRFSCCTCILESVASCAQGVSLLFCLSALCMRCKYQCVVLFFYKSESILVTNIFTRSHGLLHVQSYLLYLYFRKCSLSSGVLRQQRCEKNYYNIIQGNTCKTRGHQHHELRLRLCSTCLKINMNLRHVIVVTRILRHVIVEHRWLRLRGIHASHDGIIQRIIQRVVIIQRA